MRGFDAAVGRRRVVAISATALLAGMVIGLGAARGAARAHEAAPPPGTAWACDREPPSSLSPADAPCVVWAGPPPTAPTTTARRADVYAAWLTALRSWLCRLYRLPCPITPPPSSTTTTTTTVPRDFVGIEGTTSRQFCGGTTTVGTNYPNCRPRTLAAARLIVSQGDETVASVITDGQFAVPLAPGDYRVRTENSPEPAWCDDVRVTVPAQPPPVHLELTCQIMVP